MNKGICIWLTGLSGAGKSTLANELSKILDFDILDGDIERAKVQTGFDKAGRDANVLRAAEKARNIVESGSSVVCAFISPYRGTREQVRKMFTGNFIEVFVNTPLEVCEARDAKGLYAKARSGEIKSFTGISDVYEHPHLPEIELVAGGVVEQVLEVLTYLRDNNLVPTGNALLLGRYQPFHDGHKALFIEALKREGFVTIGVRSMPKSENNPYDFAQITKFIENKLIGFEGKYQILPMPNITNIVYGRDVGYKITKVALAPEIEQISSTKIRANNG